MEMIIKNSPTNHPKNAEGTFCILNFVSFRVFRGQRAIVSRGHGSF